MLQTLVIMAAQVQVVTANQTLQAILLTYTSAAAAKTDRNSTSKLDLSKRQSITLFLSFSCNSDKNDALKFQLVHVINSASNAANKRRQQ